MHKIALGKKNVYTIFDMQSVMRSEMVRGKLERAIKPDEYKELEYTRIDFVLDRGRVGVLIIPTPQVDVKEYFQMHESQGKIVGFEGVKYGERKSLPHEDPIIERIITELLASKHGHLRLVKS